MSSEKWFYAKNGEKSGPVSGAALKQMANSREIGMSDLVWREGMAEWTPAAKVKGLFPESVIASCPPPLSESQLSVANAPEANLDERYGSLYCSSDERVVFGLAGGLAHKFGVPVGVVRFLVFISMFFSLALPTSRHCFCPSCQRKACPGQRRDASRTRNGAAEGRERVRPALSCAATSSRDVPQKRRKSDVSRYA
jgi:hypothetical protein